MAGTSWGQQKETLLMTYKAVGRSIINYAAPVWMKETLYTRHRNTVEPMMVENDRKATLLALHTAAVVKGVQCHERNVVLDGRPTPISNSEKELTRQERSTLAQLRSGYC